MHRESFHASGNCRCGNCHRPRGAGGLQWRQHVVEGRHRQVVCCHRYRWRVYTLGQDDHAGDQGSEAVTELCHTLAAYSTAWHAFSPCDEGVGEVVAVHAINGDVHRPYDVPEQSRQVSVLFSTADSHCWEFGSNDGKGGYVLSVLQRQRRFDVRAADEAHRYKAGRRCHCGVLQEGLDTRLPYRVRGQ